MERFLQIRELKDKVCLELGADSPSLLLWREIDLVRPLVACLPKDAYRLEERPSVLRKRYTVFPNAGRELASADLEQFQAHYAHRIRVVYAGGRFMRGTFSPEFLQALVAVTSGPPNSLSPRLKAFRWNGSAVVPTAKQLLPYLALLVGPSVTSIALPIVADPDGSMALTASRLPHLEDVSLGPADLDFVDKFMTMAACSSLSDLETAANLLEHLPSRTALQELRCLIPELSPPTASQGIINAIASHTNPATLSTLQVMDYRDSDPDDFREVAPHRGFDGVVIDISPLSGFTNLRTVFLFFYGRVQVTPSDAKMIATSWTQLKELDLSGTYPIDRPPAIDHSHFFQKLEGCPKLRYIGVPFDCRGIQGNEVSPRGPFSNIEEISVYGSLVEYPSCLAAFFIRTNFPAARLSRSYPDGLLIPLEPSWKCWGDIGDALDPEGPTARDEHMS